MTASGVRPRSCDLRSVSPITSLRFSKPSRRPRSHVSSQGAARWSFIAQAASWRVRVVKANSSRKPHSANHRSNEQALTIIFAFRHPLTPTGRRDAGRRRRRLLWSRCDAGAIPCPGKWEYRPASADKAGRASSTWRRELLLLNRPWGGCASSVP